jgi:hypothetical protein
LLTSAIGLANSLLLALRWIKEINSAFEEVLQLANKLTFKQ